MWRPAPRPAEPEPKGGAAAPEAGAPGARPADDVFAGLDPHALVRAEASGELFARFGAELVRAFDRWRTARRGDAAGFREALAARVGIELPAWSDG